jgi:hypothetical protein
MSLSGWEMRFQLALIAGAAISLFEANKTLKPAERSRSDNKVLKKEYAILLLISSCPIDSR